MRLFYFKEVKKVLKIKDEYKGLTGVNIYGNKI